MNNDEIKKISICDFLMDKNVIIPILQRDYAQGRKGKGYIREKILKEVKESLKNNRELTFDFVYGNVDGERFYPLDGQQRLTTIWLIYWYFSVMSNKLSDEKNLLKFSYETRTSSRDFIKCICDEDKMKFKNKKNIVDFIQNQNWFFSEWKNDPTINSMLRMIGGTNDNDGIEPVFENSDYSSYLDLFKKNIKFYILKIGEEKITKQAADRLYVKMNARGKSLSDFENFKADLIFYLSTDKNIKNGSFKNEKLQNYIPANIDNNWNDIFWKSSNAGDSDGVTDELFFTFVNRFCLFKTLFIKIENNDLDIDNLNIISDEKNGKNNKLKREEQINNLDEIQKKLYLTYNYFYNERKFSYEKFDKYSLIFTNDNIVDLIKLLNNTYNNFDPINEVFKFISEIVSNRGKIEYSFLPKYDKKSTANDKIDTTIKEIKETTQKERIYFFSCSLYLIECKEFNKDNFKNWMIFCRNLIENSNISSAYQMASCIRKISEFSKGIDDINGFLKEFKNINGETETDFQIKEEKEKAEKKISDPSFVKIINDAENSLFFCGQIRCLYKNENGIYWDNFEEKYKKVKECFENRNGSFFAKDDFVKKYALMYKDFDEVKGDDKTIFHNIGWNERGDNWLKNLSNKNLLGKTNKILLNKDEEKAEKEYKKFVESDEFKNIINKNSSYFQKKIEGLRISFYNGYYCLYKKGSQDRLYFGLQRNEILLVNFNSEEKFKINEKHYDKNVKSPKYLWGEDVEFVYNNKNYIWKSNDSIFMYDIQKVKPIGAPKITSASTKNIEEIKSELLRTQSI